MTASSSGAWEEAFKLRPDPAYLFRYRSYEAACRAAATALREGRGLVLLLGGAGVGKSLLLQDLDVTLRLSGDRVVLRTRPDLSSGEVDGFAAGGEGGHGAGENRRTILLIDEARGLDRDVLRTLMALAAPEDGPPRLRVVLAALPGFAFPKTGAEPAAVRVELDGIADDEAGAYIAHRLAVAGHEGPSPFSEEAVARIAGAAGGVPRRINRICGLALLNSRLDGTDGVSAAQVDAVLAEMPELAPPPETPPTAAAAEPPPPLTALPVGEPALTQPAADRVPLDPAIAAGSFRIEASWTEMPLPPAPPQPAVPPLAPMRLGSPSLGGPAAAGVAAGRRSRRVGRLLASLAVLAMAMAGAAGAAVYIVSNTDGQGLPAVIADRGSSPPVGSKQSPEPAPRDPAAEAPAEPGPPSAAAGAAPAEPPDPPFSPAADRGTGAAAGPAPDAPQQPDPASAPETSAPEGGPEAGPERADAPAAPPPEVPRPRPAPAPAAEPQVAAAQPEAPAPDPPAAADRVAPEAPQRRAPADRDDAAGDHADEGDDPELEMTVTEMLNILVRHGFAEVREIRRQNGRYVVEVLTRDLRTRVLEVDPITRRVRERPLPADIRPGANPVDIRPGAQQDPTGLHGDASVSQRPF